ncbi:ectoine/hydroxyectoine ABC transporter substrate-binding protein EhuB [Opitutales bacterium ASA1]|nr:ectoine/hydroxyectoine ABC transporter substrate-binding protein EhuB [Opitutales bacterium ASA1]
MGGRTRILDADTPVGSIDRTVLAVLVLALLAWFSTGAWIERHDGLAGFRRGEPLRVGYAIEEPFAFVVDGRVTGESPEVVRAFAAALGIERIDWVQTTFGSLLPELESGRFDIVAAGMFATPERRERFEFSQPTFRVTRGLLGRRDKIGRVAGYEELARATTCRVAVVRGSYEESMFRSMGLSGERLVIVPDALTGRACVENGLADALALSAPSVRWMAARSGDASIVAWVPEVGAEAEHPEFEGGIVFRLEDDALRAAFDRFLDGYLGSKAHVQTVAAFGFAPGDFDAKGRFTKR